MEINVEQETFEVEKLDTASANIRRLLEMPRLPLSSTTHHLSSTCGTSFPFYIEVQYPGCLPYMVQGMA